MSKKMIIHIEVGPLEAVKEPRAFGMPPAEFRRVRVSGCYETPPEVQVDYPGERPVKLKTQTSKSWEVQDTLPAVAFEAPGHPTEARWRTYVAARMASQLILAILQANEEEECPSTKG